MSPSFFSLHLAAVFFDDCGIGSDPDATGPCTGTYGPGPLSNALNEQLLGGKAELLAIGAALLVLAALLVMVRMIRKPTGVRTSGADSADLDDYVCRKCGSDDISGSSVDLVVCGACGFAGNADFVGGELSDEEFAAKIESLKPGESWCQSCDLVYWSENDGCPACGGGRRDDSDRDFSCPECGSAEVNSDGETWLCDSCGANNYVDVADARKADEKEADYQRAVLASGSDQHQDHEAQTGPGYTTCGVCGFADDVENIEENGGTCNACRSDMEENHWREGSGIGGKDGFR